MINLENPPVTKHTLTLSHTQSHTHTTIILLSHPG